jgi:LysM repeat protein
LVSLLAIFLVFLTPGRSAAQENEIKGTYYLVQEGDSLWGISALLGIPIAELQTLNGISDPNQLMIGMHLLIPVPYPQMNVAKDLLGN